MASPFARGGARALFAGLAVWSSLQFGAHTLQRSLSALELGRTTAHDHVLCSPFAHGGVRALLAAVAAASPSPCSALVPVPAELGLQATAHVREEKAASALVTAFRAAYPSPLVALAATPPQPCSAQVPVPAKLGL